jgi:hypothetical protein
MTVWRQPSAGTVMASAAARNFHLLRLAQRFFQTTFCGKMSNQRWPPAYFSRATNCGVRVESYRCTTFSTFSKMAVGAIIISRKVKSAAVLHKA